MMEQLLLCQCLTIPQILDLLTVGNVLKPMVSCVTMTTIIVKSLQLDHLTELMVSAVNLVFPESIAIVLVNILAVNLQNQPLVVTSLLSLLVERIIKCLLFAQVQEINKIAE